MMRDIQYGIAFQILTVFWVQALVCTCFLAVCLVMVLQEPRDDRRPRFNLKEI